MAGNANSSIASSSNYSGIATKTTGIVTGEEVRLKMFHILKQFKSNLKRLMAGILDFNNGRNGI